MSRPLVQVRSADNATVTAQVPLPEVLTAPIRPDLVRFVHTQMRLNKRQPYSVSYRAGEQTSAESWGTGRAVARIPRVGGGGTSRSGQGAFGNMCRGGRMFAPTKIWRRWHRKVNVNMRRYALCSALSASAIPALVMARGHQIENTHEAPLVVTDAAQSVVKTANAVALLKRLGAYDDVLRVQNGRDKRAGKGKMRGRRFRQGRGPLVVYNKNEGLSRAFRNLPGVETTDVTKLNLLSVAPGGHLGRFIIWTESAFNRLNELFGTQAEASTFRQDYHPPRSIVSNTDITRIINSDEVKAVLRPAKRPARRNVVKRNPLRNIHTMIKLNPHHKNVVRREIRRTGRKKVAVKIDKKLKKEIVAGKRKFGAALRK